MKKIPFVNLDTFNMACWFSLRLRPILENDLFTPKRCCLFHKCGQIDPKLSSNYFYPG